MTHDEYQTILRIKRRLARLKELGLIYSGFVVRDKNGVLVCVRYRSGHPICTYSLRDFLKRWKAGNIQRLSRDLKNTAERIHGNKTDRPRRPNRNR